MTNFRNNRLNARRVAALLLAASAGGALTGALIVVIVGVIWGGESPKWGASWTPTNPYLLPDARKQLGLPLGNSGEMLTVAIVLMPPDDVRRALSAHGNEGGAQEWLFYNSTTQLEEYGTMPANF